MPVPCSIPSGGIHKRLPGANMRRIFDCLHNQCVVAVKLQRGDMAFSTTPVQLHASLDGAIVAIASWSNGRGEN